MCAALLIAVNGSARAEEGCGTVGYSYDAAGRLVGVSDPLGMAASYSYDEVSNTTQVSNLGISTLRVLSFSPAHAPVGASVSISGGCFSATPADNVVTFGGVPATVTFASSDRLVAQVPPGAASGPVRVALGTALADSAATFTVDAAGGGPRVTSVTPTIVVAGDPIAVTGEGFDSEPINDTVVVGQTFSTVDSATTTSLTAVIPAGAGTGRVGVRTPTGEATSTSDVFVVPSPYTVASVADTRRVALGTAQAVTIPTAGRIALLAFDLGEDEFANVSLSGGTFGTCGLNVYVRDPKTTVRQSLSCAGTSGVLQRFGGRAGTWVLLLAAQGAATGTTTVTVNPVPADPVVPTTAGGSAVALATTVPGQNASVTFPGVAGQRVSVHITGATTGSTNYYLKSSAGATLASNWTTGTSVYLDTVALPGGDVYSVVVDPTGATVGSMSVRVYEVPADASVAATVGGSAVTVALTTPGQNGAVTFPGTAGQRVSVHFTAGTVGAAAYAVKTSTGTVLASTTTTATTLYFDTFALPAADTYTVSVNPTGANFGSITVRIHEVPADVSVAASAGGAAVVLPIGTPGQNGAVTFPGTAGQRVSVHFTAGNLGSTAYALKTSTGTTLATSSTTATSLFFDTLTLPAADTYTMSVNPNGATVGSITVRVYDVPADVEVPTTVGGPAVGVTLTTPGQNGTVTFPGTAGQVVTVAVTAASIGSSTYTVREPDGSTLVTRTTGATSTTFADQTLPVDGTYSLLVNPPAATTGSATVQVTPGTAPPAAPDPAVPGQTGEERARGEGAAAQQPGPARAERAQSDSDPPVDAAEAWLPDRFNLAGADWNSHRAAHDITTPALSADRGVTAVSGQVLLLTGRPLPGVTLSVDGRSTTTDGTGRFLLSGLPAGHHEMVIDGSTANTRRRSFGVFEVGIDLTAGRTLVLPYTIWMTRLDTRHAVRFPSPTRAETVITTSAIPGFEVRLPAGSVVTDRDGRPVRSLSITAIPVDRPPFPLPAGVVTPVYFTVQPGGSYVFPDGATIVYPNSHRLAAGSRVDFWNYGPDGRGWYVYGRGRVTADGRQIVPDPGVRVWEFTGAMINAGPLRGAGSGPSDDGELDGDPVDLGTGLFIETHTDLVLPDIMPIAITRTYRPADDVVRPFGIGTNFTYGIFLQSDQQYTEADLVLPDSGKVHMVRTSPGGGFADAVFETTDTTGPFRNAIMAWNGNGWDLVRTDGMVYVFGVNNPLQAIRDRHGNQITIIRDSGGQSGKITTVVSPSGRWFAFTYDRDDRISQVRDSAGRAVTYVYDNDDRLITVFSPAGRATFYGYDAENRMTSIADPRFLTYLTNTYDANDRVESQTLADGTRYQFAYETDGSGDVTETTVSNPEGRVTVTSFAGGRVSSQTVAAGTTMARTTTTVRDPTTHLPTRLTDPHGRVTAIGYDSNGDVIAVTSHYGTPSASTATITRGGPFAQPLAVTDPAGHITRFAYNAKGDLTSTTDAEGRVSTTTYTASGQPVAVTDPLGNTTTFGFTMGDLTSVTDPLGRTSQRITDAAGRPIAMIDPLWAGTLTDYDLDNLVLSETDPLGNTTRYGYDGNGNLTTVTDARGHTTTFSHDVMDRVTSMTDPLGHIASVGYDLAGRVTTTTDRLGKTTTAQYNALGQATLVSHGVGQANASTISNGYDSLDRLTTVTDSTDGTVTLTYDDQDQITAVATPTGTLTYTYDTLGRTTTTTVPGQASIDYDYDDTGLLTSVAQGGTVATWNRDGAGRVTSLVRPSVTTSYTYNAASQLTGLTFTNASAAEIGDLTYTYDPVGRIAAAGGSLARVTIPAGGQPATYDAADRLTALGGQTFTYDDEGQLTGDGTRTYAWNARGELTGVTGPGLAASFGYDPVGRRTATTVNGAITSYVYDGAAIVRETGGATPVDRLAGGRDITLRRGAGADATSPITDGLGSVIGLVDDSGQLTTEYTYDPYGKVTATGTASGNTQQYTGREHDSATGLQYNRLRYYNPDLGRFISQDPAGFGGGSTNLYRYALSDPVNLSDPNGDSPLVLLGAFLIGGATSVAIGWGMSALTGRKYTFSDGLRDFLIGGMMNVAFAGLGTALKGAYGAWKVARLGSAVDDGFNGLTRASEFGLHSYRDLRKVLKGTGLQAHHLIEKRFRHVFDAKTADMLSVAVTPDEHYHLFTKVWREAIPYGQATKDATRDQVEAVARRIYANYPTILQALGL